MKPKQKELFVVEKLTGTIVAGFILWFSINFLLYIIGAFMSSSWWMPRYLLFLFVVNVIIASGAAIAIFNSEKESNNY